MAINESILNGSSILLFHGTAAKNKGKFEVKKPSNFYPFFCTEDIDYAKNYSEKTGSPLQKRQENSKIYIIQLKDNVKCCDF